ncbi:MAG: DUF3108 domain-containing protein [Gammaproteobacteria bacterium]|nr:DUF3108 domain-containing protein [Gammaproteobacteria bacterium]
MLSLSHLKKLQPVILLFVLLFSHTLLAARALPEFKAAYAVQKFGMKLAEAHYQLSYTDAGYKFTQNTELYGFASLFADDSISAFSLINTAGDNLLLTKYHFVQTGSDTNENEDIDILWNTYKNTLKGEITGVVKGKKINVTTDTEIWEALSFQIPLMIEAKKDVKEYPYKAILDGEIDTYNFVLTSSEKIGFAGKQYQSLHVVRSDPVKDRKLHIWLLPELHNIPVIVENYRDGKLHSRLQLESIQFGNAKPLIESRAEDDDF